MRVLTRCTVDELESQGQYPFASLVMVLFPVPAMRA
jgi:hypothetical protein